MCHMGSFLNSRSPDNVYFLRSFIFFNQSREVTFSASFCEPPYPCVSPWCVQEFPEAILEWQPSLQHWPRSMLLILVSRVKGERKHVQSQEAFLSQA